MLLLLRMLRRSMWWGALCLIVLVVMLGFLAVCGIPILAVVLNRAAIGDVMKQAATAKFPTVSGVVIRSEMSTARGHENEVWIEYEYEVGGQRYVCDRVSEQGTRGERSATFLRRHPIGSKVLVHYSPDKPGYALLDAGIVGSDLVLPLLWAPIDVLSLAMLGFLVRGIYLRLAQSEAGVRVRFVGLVKRVRIPARPTPTEVLLHWTANQTVGTTAITLALFFLLNRYRALGIAIPLVWACAVVLVPGFGYLRRAWPIWRGHEDLSVNPMRRELLLPRGNAAEPVVVGFGDVIKIFIEERPPQHSPGKTKYLPTLEYRDACGQTKTTPLTRWYDSARAEKLAAWLRKQTGLEQRPPETGL